MNNGSRYRRNKRKKRIRTIILVSICVILVLFVIFMVAGLILSEKTNDPDTPNNETQNDETSSQQNPTVNSIKAYPLALLEDGSTFNTRLSSLPEETTSVCISLNTPKGELLFRSSVSSHFSNLLVKSDATQLSKYIPSIENNDFYCSGLLYMVDFSNGNSEFIGDVYSSIWAAIACEAIDSGVNDVLLIPKETENNVEKLCLLAQSIHLTNKNAIIGLAIPQIILEDENSTELINRLSKAFNYLAIDTTNIKQSNEITPQEQIENSIKGLQLQIMYHNMRILLPKGASTEEQNSFIESVTKYNITNWQISPNQ